MAESTYTVISTKIPPKAKEKLTKIAKGWNLSCYELFQALLLVIIRYFDKETIISEELNSVVQAFLNELSTYKDSFNPLGITAYNKEKIDSAILFAKTKDNQIPQLFAVYKDENGTIKDNYNIDDLLSMFLNSFDPKILELLNKENKNNSNFSLAQTLHDLVIRGILADKKDEIKEDIKTMFSDVRICTGQKINNDVFYKRKKNIGDYTQTETYKHPSYRADL